MTTTPEQASHAINMLRECGDHHSAEIIGSLAEQVEVLTKELKSEADSHEAWQAEHLLVDGAQCRQIRELEAERDALRNEVAFFKDAAAKFCTDLSFVERERDAAFSASRYETDLCGQALSDLKIMTAERDALKVAMEDAGLLADHGIPFYAYGDHEAACEMANRLNAIKELL
ncbi:MAG: hypothetical protein JJD98_00030 [Polaromonas sp.]|nr:hypothetical protein [Polaromonas sp.]